MYKMLLLSFFQTRRSEFTLQICVDSVQELCRGPAPQCGYDPPPGHVPAHVVQRSYRTGRAAVALCAHASPPASQTSARANSAPGFAE